MSQWLVTFSKFLYKFKSLSLFFTAYFFKYSLIEMSIFHERMLREFFAEMTSTLIQILLTCELNKIFVYVHGLHGPAVNFFKTP